MTLNRLKLGRAVTFIEYIASVVSLKFLAKTLIWNKTNFPTLNLMHLPKNLPKIFFLFDLSLINVKISRASN